MINVRCHWPLPSRERIVINFAHHPRTINSELLLSVEEAEHLAEELLCMAKEIKQLDKETNAKE